MNEMNKNDKFLQFLEGGEIPANEKFDQQTEENFVNIYKQLIKDATDESSPDFDAFEKVKARHSRFQVKRLIPYAAILVLILSILLFVHLLSKKPERPKFTEAEILEARKNTEMALAYFTQEWNESLANFNNVKISSQINEELKSLKEIKIEYNNPIKNLNINEL